MARQWFNAQVISQTESNYITTALQPGADFTDCELSQVTLLLPGTLYQSFYLQTLKHEVEEVNQ